MSNTSRNDGFSIIRKSGLSDTKAKAFEKKNSAAVERYGETYQNLDDEKLKKNFNSRNKYEVSAMIVATDRLADQGVVLDSSNPRQNKRNETLLKNEYNQALDDLNEGEEVGSHNPKAFTAVNRKAAKKKKQAEKRAEKAKEAKAKVKVKSHSIEMECGATKSCSLTEFRIDSAPKSEPETNIPDSIIFNESKSDVLKMIDANMEAEKLSNIVDIFNSKKSLEVVHIISGKQQFYQQNIKVVAKGSCDHGNTDTSCPQVHIKSTNAPIGKTKSNDLWLNNTDNQLVNTRIFPHNNPAVAPDKSLKGFINLLRDNSGKHQSSYDLESRSCQEHVYNGYFGQLVVHRPNVIKYGIKIVTPIFGDKSKDRKIKVSAEFYSRMDTDEFKHTLQMNSLKGLVKEIIPGPAWLADTVFALQHTLNRMSALGTEDGESEALEVVADDVPEEYPPMSEQKVPDDPDASIQPIEIHIAYRRILKPLPDYSDVAYKHEMYLALAPMIRYTKTVNAINTIWKSSLRASAAAVSGGLSEAAIYLSDKTGIVERTTGAFEAFCTVIRTMGNSYKLEDKEVDLNSPSLVKITDEEVSAYLGTNNVGVGAKVKCLLEMSMAAETDDPGNGFVVVKEPDEKVKFDSGASGFYAGVNASITGEVQSNLRLLKILGFSLGREATTGAKIEVISEDNTAPVRLGVNLNFSKDFVKKAEELAQNKQKIAEAAEKTRLEANLKLSTVDKDNTEDYKEAKNIVKEAEKFAKKAQKAADKAQDNIEYAQKQEEKANSEPLGMQSSLLFSGMAVYFSAYIELTKYSMEAHEEDGANEDDSFNIQDEEGELSGEPELEELSKTTMHKKFGLCLLKEKDILPGWRPLPFSHLANLPYPS